MVKEQLINVHTETRVTNYKQKLEDLQNMMIANNDRDGIYGDGKTLVNNEEFKITHDFSDQLYMRKMRMPEGSFVVSAIHHTDHFWFLLSGRIFVTTDGETVEHVAPCYARSIKGAKRFIVCAEECLFINVHKNPSNSQDIEEVQDELYSITIEEYNKKEKSWQE
jgi:hypothetical protein